MQRGRAPAKRTGRVLRVVLVVPSMLSSHSPASVPSVFRVATTPWSSVAAAAVVSGAGVTSYDRRWCWCRHAHTSSRHPPAPNLHICLLRRHLQIMTYTVCADRRQRGQPTALLVPSVGRVGDCCCCGLLPRAQMTHVHTSSKQHSLGRVIVPMSTAPILCRWGLCRAAWSSLSRSAAHNAACAADHKVTRPNQPARDARARPRQSDAR